MLVFNITDLAEWGTGTMLADCAGPLRTEKLVRTQRDRHCFTQIRQFGPLGVEAEPCMRFTRAREGM